MTIELYGTIEEMKNEMSSILNLFAELDAKAEGVRGYEDEVVWFQDINQAREMLEKLDEYSSWVEEFADEADPEFPAKETSRRRKHIKGDNKAKRHLATVYPISTDSVRRTRNGAYIHKGNTCEAHGYWKRYDNKLSRLEGKRLCREWEPEEPDTTVPEEPDILTRIADLEEELHWNMMELSAAQAEVDYYLQECLEISNEIERLRKLL